MADTWIPCEVRPGAFSNERLVRIHDKWCGFVQMHFLRKENNQDLVKAKIVGIGVVKPYGDPITANRIIEI